MLMGQPMLETEKMLITSGLYPKEELTQPVICERFQKAVIDLLLVMQTVR